MNTNNTSNPPFRIGQKVVALKDSVYGYFKKGVEYTVLDVHQCQCGYWTCHIGFIANNFINCTICVKSVIFPGEKTFHGCSNFAPIEENKERIRYVAVSETLREKAEEVVVESCNLS